MIRLAHLSDLHATAKEIGQEIKKHGSKLDDIQRRIERCGERLIDRRVEWQIDQWIG